MSLVLPPAHLRNGEVDLGEGLSSGGLPLLANALRVREILPIAAPENALEGVSVVIHATLAYTGSTPKFPT